MTMQIIIEDYNPHWPKRFELLRAPIAAALAPLAGAIEHVGSTAVPGLAAKPIIDIDIVLASVADLRQAVVALGSLRYEHEGDLGIPGRDAFRAPPDSFPHHLYVCSRESEAYRQHIAFRDHLRTHSADAADYASLKRRLAAEFGTDRAAYTQAKSEFVERILRSAGNFLPGPRVL